MARKHAKANWTAKKQRFCEEYLVDLNATQAAIRTGYSVRSAADIGRELLKQDTIQACIAELTAARANRTGVTADRVIEELSVLGFSNVNDFTVDESGRVVLVDGARPEAIRAVASVKCKRRTIRREGDDPIEEVETEIRLWNKPEALKLAGQHLGIYTKKIEHTLPPGAGVLAVPVPVDAAQWAATAEQQQANLLKTPSAADARPE